MLSLAYVGESVYIARCLYMGGQRPDDMSEQGWGTPRPFVFVWSDVFRVTFWIGLTKTGGDNRTARKKPL
ncbi:MAG: hypothetical protein FalmKO_07350 [Falsiruegeria mediterranea]